MLNDAIALLKGFWTTVKYTARPAVTIQYPDVKRKPADKYRGRHRLYKTDDGLERCIGCSLCAAACPSPESGKSLRVDPACSSPTPTCPSRKAGRFSS